MENTIIILCFSLLFGVCCGKSVYTTQIHDDMRQDEDRINFTTEMDESRDMADYMGSIYYQNRTSPEYGKGPTNDDYRNQRRLPYMSSLKDAITYKLEEVYNGINEKGIINFTAYFGDLPSFVDPLDVGSAFDKFSSASIEYKSVQFYGLNNPYKAGIYVDAIFNKVMVNLYLTNAQIKGQYTASNVIKKTSGNFQINFSGNISYLLHYSYFMNNSEIQLSSPKGELAFNDSKSTFENIGFFAQFFGNVLSHSLLETVNQKIKEEVSPKLTSKIQYYIGRIQRDVSNVHISRFLETGIKNTNNKFRNNFSTSGDTSVDLRSNDREFMYNNLQAKIASLKLRGMDKFNLTGNVSYDDKDIRAKIQLAVKDPIATALISIHNGNDEDAPFQKMNVDFVMNQVYAELELEKLPTMPGLQVSNVKTYANWVKPENLDQYEEETRDFIKQKLSSHIQHYIEDGLKNFILSEVMAMIVQGILPPFDNQQQWQ